MDLLCRLAAVPGRQAEGEEGDFRRRTGSVIASRG
jgi:hypothetical protein